MPAAMFPFQSRARRLARSAVRARVLTVLSTVLSTVLALSALALSALAAPALTAPAFAQGAPTIETFTTPGGVPVRRLAMPDADYSTLIVFWANDAAFRDPAKAGLFRLGTQLPLMGAGGRTFEEIGEDLNDAREGLSFGNSLSGTALVLNAQADDDAPFAESAEAANAVLTDPALDPDDLEELQAEIADNLAASEADPAIMAERAVGAFIGGGDPRLPALTNRPVETVTSVGVDDVRAFMDEAVHAAPLVVAAGPAGEEAIGAAVDGMLAGLTPAPEAAPAVPAPIAFERAGQTLAVSAPGSEVAIVTVPLLVRTPSPPVGAALESLAGGDGSRLFTTLREELGATYGVEIRVVPLLADTQLTSLVAAVPPDRANEVAELMREAIAQVRTGGMTADELEGGRERSLAFLDQVDADPGALANVVIDRLVRDGEVPDDMTALNRELINGNDLATANAALPDLLPERATVVILTPEPDAVEADCTVDVPEEAADCPTQ